MMSEFNSPWVGEAGLRVSSGCWGWDVPGGVLVHTCSRSRKCLVPGVSWALSLLWPAGRTESPVVRIPKGTVVLQNLVPILAAAVAVAHWSLPICDAGLLSFNSCQICWLRCKWIETDCRDFQIAKHTKAGTSSGYLWINNLSWGVLGPVFH